MDLRTNNTATHATDELAYQTALQRSIHAAHADERLAIMLALMTSVDDRHVAAAKKLNRCATSARLHWSKAKKQVRPAVLRCRQRMCPHCAKIRSASTTAKVHELIKTYKEPRFIVLTVAHSDETLQSQLRELRDNFSRLRRMGFWEHNVLRGVYTIEVTRNQETHQWHPHLNIIYDGNFLAQKQLRFAWNKATGSAKIVWITAVKDREGAAYELCKYIGKPQHVADLETDEIREYWNAVHGTRMIQAFGKKLDEILTDEDPADPDEPESRSVTISRLVYMAGQDKPGARDLVDLVARRWPMFAGYVWTTLPDLAPPEWQQQHESLTHAMSGKFPARARAPARTEETNAELDRQLDLAFARFAELGDLYGNWPEHGGDLDHPDLPPIDMEAELSRWKKTRQGTQ